MINLTADNRVINVGGATAQGLDQVPNGVIPTAPFISAADAPRDAAPTLGLPPSADAIVASGSTGLDRSTTLLDGDLSLDPIPARLDYVASANSLDLAWGLILRTPDGDHWYDAQVDASEGTILGVDDWVDHASYDVFAPPVENPDMGSRTIQTNPADTTASPYGWHDTNGVPGAEYTTTQGNNVFAQEDTDANDAGGFRPDGGGGLNFNFPLDLTQDPSTYQSAAITQLFYTNNIMHDIFYHYGFDEVSGNFQVNNYGHGGLGGDAVQADAQDGSDLGWGYTDNANFDTPPDGTAPRMQMYVWDWTLPLRDGDLDNGIIIHEYGHGISNRLTGGPSNSNALHARQSGGMGEGWSDFFALMLTQLSTDTQNQAYPLGTYALGQPPSGGGFRREPYSFDMSIDSLTLGAYNSSQEVHDAGEIWASTLWDLNWLLIQRHGFNPNLYAGYTGSGSAGNILALRLITDAMKLQPANPRFTDARDAILQADMILTGGANQDLIWQAFARRGLGYSAYCGADANSLSVTEAFDLPPTIDVGDILSTASLVTTRHLPTEVANGRIGDGAYGAKDVDLYKFTVTAGDTITATTALPSGGTAMDTYLRLFNSSGTQLAFDDDSGGNYYSSLTYTFTASGTYYIGVSGYANTAYNPKVGGSGMTGSTGDYRLTMDFDVSDTLAKALPVTLGPTSSVAVYYTENIGDGAYRAKDVDLYKFTVTAGDTITATTALPSGGTAMDTYLRLFNSSGTQLAFDDDSGGNYYSSLTYTFTASGTYYIGVSGYGNTAYNPTSAGNGVAGDTGDYSLTLNLDHGDTLVRALPVTLGPTSSLAVYYTENIGDGAYGAKDVDLYKFTVTAGDTLTATTGPRSGGEGMNTILRLFNSSGTQTGLQRRLRLQLVLGADRHLYRLGHLLHRRLGLPQRRLQPDVCRQRSGRRHRRLLLDAEPRPRRHACDGRQHQLQSRLGPVGGIHREHR